MAGKLTGKVAVITGAAGGFGRVFVQGFLAEGAKVAALDVNESGLQALQEEFSSKHATRLLVAACDIADHAACERAVATANDALGGLHILINNGALGMGAIRADHFDNLVGIDEITPQMWQRFVSINFTGAWNMTRAAIPKLRSQRWGRIINVTTSFLSMLRGGFHPYGPCKAALEAMSAGHAKEFEGSGVTVHVVIPGGPSDTPMVPAESGFERKDLIPPTVMVPPTVWLCSEAANGLTGNRYVARFWDTSKPPEQAERECRAPIAWPELTQNFVWPGGKPGK